MSGRAASNPCRGAHSSRSSATASKARALLCTVSNYLLHAQAVVAADVELMELREEEAELTRRLGAVSLDETANGASSAPAAAPATDVNGCARQHNGRSARAAASDDDSDEDDGDNDRCARTGPAEHGDACEQSLAGYIAARVPVHELLCRSVPAALLSLRKRLYWERA